MTMPLDHRGGMPVGGLADLPALEFRAVRCLRLWCDGPDGWTRMQAEMADLVGPCRACRLGEAFDLTCRLMLEFCHRPLVRHEVDCPCLGADEATFAHLVRLAGLGDREEAMLLATHLVRADMAPIVVSHAARVGLELHRAGLCDSARARPADRLH
ncbi:MAG: hypothetical protein KDA73_10895 [Rhodobacteraceae bacterium]|nr:hypothetical protein [Paracoccaceae bacterium]